MQAREMTAAEARMNRWKYPFTWLAMALVAGATATLQAATINVFAAASLMESMKEIAGVLKITRRTVAFHKYRMMEVLNAKSSAELVHYAMRHHLIAA